MSLEKLHQKLEEYNREHNENWMILIDSTRFNFVFIIDSEDIAIAPKWWPKVDVSETVESALGLVPLKATFTIKITPNNGYETKDCWTEATGHSVSKEDTQKVIKTLRLGINV